MRNFGIVFDGGFALATEDWQITNVVSRHSNVEIKEYSTRKQAYFYTAYTVIGREYWRNPWRQFPLPKLEDMTDLNWVFSLPDYVGHVNSPVRTFAALNSEYVGILDSTETLISFLIQVPFSEAKEFNNFTDALNHINFCFLKYILPFSAYISGEITRYSTIPINTMTPTIFNNWQNLVQLPNGISPLTYLPAANKESNHHALNPDSQTK